MLPRQLRENLLTMFGDMDKEQRVELAKSLFKEGYNCAQAVTAAYADLYGFSREQALRMSASFGGGIGKMRETCGAACGMFILAGLKTGTVDPSDREGKAANYAFVRELAEKFRQENGALKCGDLLGLSKQTAPEGSVLMRKPKRPCYMMVESAARIWSDYL